MYALLRSGKGGHTVQFIEVVLYGLQVNSTRARGISPPFSSTVDSLYA